MGVYPHFLYTYTTTLNLSMVGGIYLMLEYYQVIIFGSGVHWVNGACGINTTVCYCVVLLQQ